MSLKSMLARIYASIRVSQLERQAKASVEYQLKTLFKHLKYASETEFGKAHNFSSIKTYADYCRQVPVQNYEGLKPWIENSLKGEADVLWPGKPNYFSKTSGTTSGTKYIPNTSALLKSHLAGARDSLLFYIHEKKQAGFLDGKMMFLSGSPSLEYTKSGIPLGRLSGIVNHFIPAYLKGNQVPTMETNCIEDWEEKIKRIVEETHALDLRLISGIPPWVQMYFEKLREKQGKLPQEVWPHLSVFVYGGVDYAPYKAIFRNYLNANVDLIETYPASEGFIAVQDHLENTGMRLMTHYGIFYEFIPMETYGTPEAKRLHLGQVETGKQYALILSNNAGLWAYDLGDTIRFTSLDPPRIKVTGRTAQFISAFGEHVIVEEINEAMAEACSAFQTSVYEFTLMPYIHPEGSCHEWFIEFSNAPGDTGLFSEYLDQKLQQKNTYYKDLIQGKVLMPLRIYSLQPGTTNAYMKSLGKLGGQNKFPRVKNDDSLRGFMMERIQAEEGK